jgi:hypothetical protein
VTDRPSAAPDPVTTTRQRTHEQRVFRVHAAVFAGCMVVIVLVNLALNAVAGITGEWWAWWSALALVGWGLGLTVHGLVVRAGSPTLRP